MPMTDAELMKALERYPKGDPVVLYHVDVTGAYVEAAASGRKVDLRPGEFWLTTNVESRVEFRGGRGLEGNIVAFQLDNRFVSLLRDLALDQRGASSTEKFMKQVFDADIAVPRVNYEGGGRRVKLPEGDFNVALRITERAPEFNRLFQISTERMDRVRYDGTQPPGARLVPFGKSGALGALSPGQKGSGMRDHEATQTAVLGALMAAGVIMSWLDDYAIDEASKKDMAEWERYIARRQQLDPENGFLLVAIIKVLTIPDAVYSARTYVGMEMIEDYTQRAAEQRAARDILPGLEAPTDRISYTFSKAWVSPLQPRPPVTQEQRDEKQYGSQPWYPRYRLVQHSLEAPPSYGEALSALQASSMWDILRVLDALPDSQFNALRSQLFIVREASNRSRFKIAFAAAEDHKSSSSFGFDNFISSGSLGADYGALGSDYDRKCIKEWVEGGSGAISHVLQGKWDVMLNGAPFEYGFYLSGRVIWRDKNNLGVIGGEGSWRITPENVRIDWPKSGTVETFPLPLSTTNQSAKCEMKTGTFTMTANKTSPYP